MLKIKLPKVRIKNIKLPILIISIALIIVVANFFMHKKQNSELVVSSPTLEKHDSLDPKYTCDGDKMSPSFEISHVSAKTAFLAIEVEDLDLSKAAKKIPNTAQWLVWNIPANTTRILEGIKPDGTIARSSDGNFRYAGPCPDDGKEHRYVFHVYATRKALNITSDASHKDFKKALRGNVVGEWKRMVKYKRK